MPMMVCARELVAFMLVEAMVRFRVPTAICSSIACAHSPPLSSSSSSSRVGGPCRS